MSTTMMVRFEDEIKQWLNDFAGVLQCTKSCLAAVAIHDCAKSNDWQTREISQVCKQQMPGILPAMRKPALWQETEKWMRVRCLRTALRELDDQSAYIAIDEPQASCPIAQRVLDAVRALADQPGFGGSGQVPGLYSL